MLFPTNSLQTKMGLGSQILLSLLLLSLLSFPNPSLAWRPWPKNFQNPNHTTTDLLFGPMKKYEGSSEFVHLRYHMGPVLTANITVHTIWYGSWLPPQKRIIRDFLSSISATQPISPSVSEWWKTVQLYTDQTGANISRHVVLGAEKNDRYSHGKSLTRLSIQTVIKNAVSVKTRPLPINPQNGLYLLLTAPDVTVQDFCGQVCGFHYFTFPSIVGFTLPYAWVGNSAKQCPGICAYPFAIPMYPGIKLKPLTPPNGDVGVDGMISVIAHEIAELSANPLINAWYAGQDPCFPTEIADLCEGIYGTGGGGSYTGQMLMDRGGATFNMNGLRRRFLVQWVWNPVLNYCFGPNALDK